MASATAPLELDLVPVGSFYTGEHLAEVRAVLAALRADGPTRFVLGGLCAGASWAANAAAAEPDVGGVLLLNPPTFHFDQRTFELTDARWMLRQALDPATWRKVARGAVDRRRPLRLARAVLLHLLGTPRRLLRRASAPAPDRTAREEETLALLPARGDRLSVIFSGDEALEIALRESQALERLATLPGVGVHHVGLPDVNTHTLRPLVIQRDVERILDFEIDAVLRGAAVSGATAAPDASSRP